MPKGSDNPFPSLLVVEGTAPASPSAGRQRLFIDSADNKLKRKNSSGTVTTIESAASTRTVGITIDGGGAVITTGVKGYIQVPFAGTITAARILADQSGSIVIDVWKDTYANYPPTDADSITASAPPTLSGAIKSEDTTLTGWTTAIAAGDILGFNVDSVSTVTRVTLQLTIQT